MSKKLDETALRNELAGSAFFRQPATPETAARSLERPSHPVENGSSSAPPSQEGGKEARRQGANEASLPRHEEASGNLTLSEKPFRKNSFLFTDREWEAFEDLRLELRRKHDIDATKNDIARCSLHLVAEDFARRGDASIIVRKLRQKGGK